MIGTLARSSLRFALTALGVLLVALAALTLVARLALPLAASKKGEIEARLGDYLERPVTIGGLELAWRAAGPALRIEDVAVFESETRGVRFDELLVDVDLFRSLWRRTPIIDELTLVGADLSVEYAGDGRFLLHGVEREAAMPGLGDGRVAEAEVEAETAAAGEGLDVLGWLLDARRVGLLDTRITLLDTERDRRLVVSELNVRAENDGGLHRLRVDLQLPPELGDTLEAGIDFEGPGSSLARAEGSVYARASALRLGALIALRDLVPARAAAANDATDPAAAANLGAVALAALGRLDGETQVELWGRFADGEIRHARSRVDARDLALRGAPSRPLLDRLEADLVYRDDAPGWTLAADRVALVAGGEQAVLEAIEIGRGARTEDRSLGPGAAATL